MKRNTTQALRAMLRVLGLATLWLMASVAQADSNAYTDDKSVDVPTSSYLYINRTPAQIVALLESNQARLTDIEVADATNNLFTVTMVRNSGVYAAGWYWYTGQTFAQVNSLLSSNNGRLIDVEPYSTTAGIRYAVIMVVNSGNTARGWAWASGVNSSQISTHLSSTGNRLIQLQSYLDGSTTRYAYISIANTGADAKGWQYWFNQTFAQVGSRLNSFGGRLTSLERRSNGNYDIVLVQNSGADGHYAKYYGGLNSSTAVVNVANQFGSRVMDIGTYVVSGQRYYDALLMDNSTTENRRIRSVFGETLNSSNGYPNGQWGAYVRSINSGSASISINGDRRFEPASAIKAVHNLATMRRVQAGTAALSDTTTYYNYYQETQRNACPNLNYENSSYDRTTTLDNARNLMMSQSDNTMTRAITLLFGTGSTPSVLGPSGIANLEDIAVDIAGMTNTFMDQDYIGCGYKLGPNGTTQVQRNQTTLVDFGKLYSGIQIGTLLGTGTFRDQFFQPMNGGAFDETASTEGDIKAMVREEGSSLGKSTAVVNDFINRMEWRHKGGGYGLSCATTGPYYACTDGYINISTLAGRLTLPSKSGGVITPRHYVFGHYTADRNICNPDAVSGTFGSCADAPAGFARTTTENTVRKNLNKELFRSIVRSNLATF